MYCPRYSAITRRLPRDKRIPVGQASASWQPLLWAGSTEMIDPGNTRGRYEEGPMNIGEPIRELEVAPLVYPAALPDAPAEPNPDSASVSDPAEVPA